MGNVGRKTTMGKASLFDASHGLAPPPSSHFASNAGEGNNVTQIWASQKRWHEVANDSHPCYSCSPLPMPCHAMPRPSSAVRRVRGRA